MVVTELATLRFLPPTTWSAPLIQQIFAEAARSQENWSGYPVFFFSDQSVAEQDVAKITLVSGWDSVEKHEEWIQSEENQRLMGLLKEVMVVDGLQHLEIDFRLAIGPGRGESIRWLIISNETYPHLAPSNDESSVDSQMPAVSGRAIAGEGSQGQEPEKEKEYTLKFSDRDFEGSFGSGDLVYLKRLYATG